ncbi:MAG: phosphoribosylformylglycinamidine cyclo-ligase [Alphaproteobacteria bacterium]
MPASRYADSGVSLARAEEAEALARSAAEAHRHRGVVEAIGGFAALFDLKAAGWSDPLLVAACDGVGSKLELAQDYGTPKAHEDVGRDLVAMCVNDLACRGAEALFFLDYIAADTIDMTRHEALLRGMSKATAEAGCALIGGETAELPGLYSAKGYDLAGFAIGAVERTHLLPRLAELRVGQPLYGLPASGVHANGFSLVRKILREGKFNLHNTAPFDESQTLGAALLTPTPVLARTLRALAAEKIILSLAHITGGGVIGNLPRVLPEHLGAAIESASIKRLPVFKWLQEVGRIPEAEMWKVFNCGLAAVLVCADEESAKSLPVSAFRIGSLTEFTEYSASNHKPRIQIV